MFFLLPKSVKGRDTNELVHIPKKRCGVRDTVASVPATFLLLFSSPEKRRYQNNPSVA